MGHRALAVQRKLFDWLDRVGSWPRTSAKQTSAWLRGKDFFFRFSQARPGPREPEMRDSITSVPLTSSHGRLLQTAARKPRARAPPPHRPPLASEPRPTGASATATQAAAGERATGAGAGAAATQATGHAALQAGRRCRRQTNNLVAPPEAVQCCPGPAGTRRPPWSRQTNVPLVTVTVWSYGSELKKSLFYVQCRFLE